MPNPPSPTHRSSAALAGSCTSLAPDRCLAHDTETVITLLRARHGSSPLLDALDAGLREIARAIHEAFPENLLWDLDALAAGLHDDAARAAEPLLHLRDAIEQTLALQELFGAATEIRFRYVHDFIYGFDWAKWVRTAPASRADVGPFDLIFLRRMHGRGQELLGLIAGGDQKYPPLRSERHRNPFAFSREPEDELALHRALAAEHAIPVEAWRVDATPTWDRPFAELRLACAERLGLG